MKGSRTIRVVKRDGSAELFDAARLAAAIWRAARKRCDYYHAGQLATAIQFYIVRRDMAVLSSAALFEMVLKTLRCVGMEEAADAMERHRSWRRSRRNMLRICHESGHVTHWDRRWLAEIAQRAWCIRSATARILAGQVESQLLAGRKLLLERSAVIDMLNEQVSQWGLADAVPVENFDLSAAGES